MFKMLIILLTFSLFIAMARAIGQMTVLQYPNSVKFTGNDPLESSYIGDVLMAVLGNTVSGKTAWPGLVINDPFNLAKTSMIVVHVQAVYRLPAKKPGLVYDLLDSNTDDSLTGFAARLSPESLHNFDFMRLAKGQQMYEKYFGNKSLPIAAPIQYLKPAEFVSNEHFLREIGFMNALADNLTDLLKPSSVIIFRLSLQRIVNFGKEPMLFEAKQMLTDAVDQLLTAAKNLTDSLLFVQTTDMRVLPKSAGNQSSSSDNPFSKFKDASDPVLLNIVVWFGLAFSLSLAIICYLIANIDPGRDSVLYRVGATHHRHHMHERKKQR